MARMVTLEELARTTGEKAARPSEAAIQGLIEDSSEDRRVLGVLLQAARFLQQDGPEAAIECLSGARKIFQCLPIPILFNLVGLCRRSRREQLAAWECLRFAEAAFAMDYVDLGLEAASAALILDAAGQYELVSSPLHSYQLSRLYERAARTLSMPPFVPSDRPADAPLRVALVVPNLVDHVVAYTRRVLQFARYADTARFCIRVYSSENHSVRAHPLFPFGCVGATSEDRGVATIGALKRLGVPVWLAPRDGRYCESAARLARRIEADGTDILLLQTGLSAPIDWLAGRVARVRVKASIHIGSSLFIDGFDAAFYDNPANLEREGEWWSDDLGERILAPTGADIAWLDAQAPLCRNDLDVPDDAVAVGTLSNHLDRRLSEPYMKLLVRVLRENPSAWFLAFGSDPIPDKQAFFDAAGVGGRVRFGGRQSNPGTALKALDIYASEFPVGGSQSVLEAMACARPVVAMKWSLSHAESAAAGLVGGEYAIPGRDVEAYASLLNGWIRNPSSRQSAGQSLRHRALQNFTAGQYVDNVLNRLAGFYRS